MSATVPLLPLHRQPLLFGALLNETFQVCRRRWPTLVTISALIWLP